MDKVNIGKKFFIAEENAEKYIKEIGKFIKDKVDSAGATGVVLGMSGGIDCSVAARLTQEAGVKITLILLPDGDDMKKTSSLNDAMDLINKFDFENRTINIREITQLIENCCNDDETELALNQISKINIKPRVRMTVLYSIAHTMGALVMGTGNLDERLLGYFTKWGDGGCDINPLGMLTKGEIRLLAKKLRIPDRIIEKPPSAGLFEGQTDETDLGITYGQMDDFIVKGSSGDGSIDRLIVEKINISGHKREPIPVYEG